jgi:hypothetical protein
MAYPEARYMDGLRAEAVRRVFFASVGVADSSGPSVRLKPPYSISHRSYSASRIPTELIACETGRPSPVSVSIICSLWTISLGLSLDLIIATPPRTAIHAASERPPLAVKGRKMLSVGYPDIGRRIKLSQ